jgi:parallel beta-helix repeat protein
MRSHHINPCVMIWIAVSALGACRSDSVSSPGSAQVLLADRQSAGGSTLVVDEDRADCRDADFTSIQAAVDAAAAGATIIVCAGTYHEWVVIGKSELRLIATGKPGDVVLDGQDIAGSACSPTSTTAVQCAGFELRDAHDNLIEGFMVRRYWEAGIWLRLGSSGNTIRNNVTTESPHHDGIQLQNSPGNVIEHNTSFANVTPNLNACGINVGGAASVGNIVRQNEVFENDFGIQVAGGAGDNVVFNNESHDNRQFGIRNVGTSNGTMIEENRVLDNTGPGIALLLGPPTGVIVARNKAFGNTLDLSGGIPGAAVFENNHCRTSVPSGLCEHTEGESK